MSSIDVIIVTYGSARLIPSCLASLAQSDEVSRVVVVDNASSDGSAEAARRAGADRVIANSCNLGFARAVNTGLAGAGGEAGPAGHVLLLNPDALLGKEALRALRAAFEADPSVAVAGPLLRAEDGTLTAGAARTATLPHTGGSVRAGGRPVSSPAAGVQPAARHRLLRRTVDVGYLFGAAVLVDRRFLTACGGLDERYFLFAEDEDLSGRRARPVAGWCWTAAPRRRTPAGPAAPTGRSPRRSACSPPGACSRSGAGEAARRRTTAASSPPSPRDRRRGGGRRGSRGHRRTAGSSTRPCAGASTRWSPPARAARRRPAPERRGAGGERSRGPAAGARARRRADEPRGGGAGARAPARAARGGPHRVVRGDGRHAPRGAP